EQQWNYATTQAALAASANTPSIPVTLMSEGGIPTSTTGKFMRTQYLSNGSESSCNLDYNLGLGSGAREIWLEVWMRFDSSWGGTSDDKTLFIYSNSQHNRRWEVHYGSWANQAGTNGSIFCGASNMTWEATVS